MERYICIHGHFYQPPRQNPWLEAVELQDSAYPYHDWNERVTAECYAPNSASRILDDKCRIVEIANNYSKISFNFGPTLLSWLEQKAPEVYQAILAADHESQKTYSGHGSALAQAYSHMILPLANRRDKYTQVLWGIRDFEHRFGRPPEGMWLPETAADLETLDIMAELGLRFTILAPHQAQQVRPIGARTWRDLGGGRIDPTMPYELRLPSGRKINLFFYDDTISRAVAFEGLLRSGEDFARRLASAFSAALTWPQIVHIATDGETYGHHQRFGDMALAYALNYIESNNLARLTNYGEYLEKHPPTHEVEILENTSWSCPHGVERWRADCGCNTGSHPGWNQAWRAPLRRAIDWLRDTLAAHYEESGYRLLKDPYLARNDYISVVLNRSRENVEDFLSQHATRPLDDVEKMVVLKLLEIERNAMLMFTSDGWFFDDISGIETVQLLLYASRALQLAGHIFEKDFEPQFLGILAQAKSNKPAQGNGRDIFKEAVRNSRVDRGKLAAHYAISSLFKSYPEQAKIYRYTVNREDYQSFQSGAARLVVGRARFASEVTWESAALTFGVLHFGDHNLNAGVREFQGAEYYQALVKEITGAFAEADFAEVIRLMDRHFGASTYSLKSLFRDEQRRILRLVLDSTLAETEALYRQLYEHHAPLIRFLSDMGLSLPRILRPAVEFVLDIDLRRAFGEEAPDLDRIQAILEEVRTLRIEFDTYGLAYELKQTIDRLTEQWRAHPAELPPLQRLDQIVNLARSLPFEVDLWKAQNTCYSMLLSIYPSLQRRAEEGDKNAAAWVTYFTALGEKLSVLIS